LAFVEPTGLDAAKNFHKAQSIDVFCVSEALLAAPYNQSINLQEARMRGVLFASIACGLVPSSATSSAENELMHEGKSIRSVVVY